MFLFLTAMSSYLTVAWLFRKQIEHWMFDDHRYEDFRIGLIIAPAIISVIFLAAHIIFFIIVNPPLLGFAPLLLIPFGEIFRKHLKVYAKNVAKHIKNWLEE